MKTIDVIVTGVTGDIDRQLTIRRMVNLGSATRDPQEAIHHHREVAEAGVNIAFGVPAPRIYPIGTAALTTDDLVQVQGHQTSGEAEFVIILDNAGRPYVGIGSDHTDRDLEKVSIPWSKQACPNILHPVLWAFEEVAEHWDDLRIECDVDGRPYQRFGVEKFLPPTDLIDIVDTRTALGRTDLAIFSGTYVSSSRMLEFGTTWSMRLIDPVLQRTLSHTYQIEILFDDVHSDYRVPLHNVQT